MPARRAALGGIVWHKHGYPRAVRSHGPGHQVYCQAEGYRPACYKLRHEPGLYLVWSGSPNEHHRASWPEIGGCGRDAFPRKRPAQLPGAFPRNPQLPQFQDLCAIGESRVGRNHERVAVLIDFAGRRHDQVGVGRCQLDERIGAIRVLEYLLPRGGLTAGFLHEMEEVGVEAYAQAAVEVPDLVLAVWQGRVGWQVPVVEVPPLRPALGVRAVAVVDLQRGARGHGTAWHVHAQGVALAIE